MPKRIVTAHELADYLDLEVSTVRRWAKSGLIPVIKPTPKVIRFDVNDVISALKRRSEAVAAAAQE